MNRYKPLPADAPLDHRKKAINWCLEKGIRSRDEWFEAERHAGIELSACRLLVPKGQWMEWCAGITGGYEKVADLTRLAEAPADVAREIWDKQREAEETRAEKQREKRASDRERNSSGTGANLSDDETIMEHIEALFHRLSQNGKARCLDHLQHIKETTP